MSNGSEKRAEPRRRIRQFVALRAVTEKRTIFAYTVDVSPSGMFVSTNDLRPLGTKLNIEGSAGSVLMVVVRVRESGATGMGLRRAA